VAPMIKVLCLDHPAYQSFWLGGEIAGAGWQAHRVCVRGNSSWSCRIRSAPVLVLPGLASSAAVDETEDAVADGAEAGLPPQQAALEHCDARRFGAGGGSAGTRRSFLRPGAGGSDQDSTEQADHLTGDPAVPCAGPPDLRRRRA
jgi:hypothetical protein